MEEYSVGVGVLHGFFYLTPGHFSYLHYLLPASDNNGSIAIPVSVGVGVLRGFSYITPGPFSYHHYLLPASENNGSIAIPVSVGFSQSGCEWTACS